MGLSWSQPDGFGLQWGGEMVVGNHLASMNIVASPLGAKDAQLGSRKHPEGRWGRDARVVSDT
jgi:hypothetical protein